MRNTLSLADIYTRVGHATPGVNMVQVVRVVDEFFNLIHVTKFPGELVFVDTTHGQVNFGSSASLPREPLKTPRGSAICGWCHEIHKIEQIKVCRWKANRIAPEVFAQARLSALRTASKLKDTP